MRIGFLCKHNAYDRNAFSGTPFYMRQALEALPDLSVTVLGGHRPPSAFRKALARVRAPAPLRPADIRTEGLDWVLSIVSSELVAPVAAASRAGLVHVTDATPDFLREFYGWDVDPARDVTEREALEAARLAIYSSRFMAERAEADFGDLGGKALSVPFGVNFDGLPDTPAAKPPMAPLNLLFVGKNWDRKGGAVALEALRALRADGIEARLSIVGCDPAAAKGVDGAEVHPFLDKNDPADYARLTGLFHDAHFFLLPTRADCTPMVVAEANAYGAPVLITDTGGIGSLMAPGANGEMLPPGADGAAYAARIRALSGAGYAALSASSFAHYRTRLNWSAWARDVVAALRAAG